MQLFHKISRRLHDGTLKEAYHETRWLYPVSYTHLTLPTKA